MRTRCFPVFLVLLSYCFGPAGLARSQEGPSEDGRKIVRKAAPLYPQVAKRVNLAGTVKVVAVVAPDGTVKSVEPMGGSPILIKAAQDAIYKWKYAPASAESKEVVELHFSPQ
jgi:outer membrane biosynthesis protein TonB